VNDVDGVTDVKIEVVEPVGPQSAPAGTQATTPAEAGPTPTEFPNLGVVVAVSSGKGGVGKSTVAANLAAEVAKKGKKVGVMDCDIYGPNIPRLFGADERPAVRDGKLVPIERHGVKLVSLGFLVERDMPAIWRGPIVTKLINQFLSDVDWGELDYLIVDLPPGTGDAQLSLAQAIQVRAGIIVTTPQVLASEDALRGAKMFERVSVPLIGVVENMSFYVCPSCGEKSEIFSGGGGQRLADELGVSLLGQVPLQADMTKEADEGNLPVVNRPDSPAGLALQEIAEKVVEKAGGGSVSLPIIT
jgi:ATP-binding protein involved in chromosome partitioning